MDFKGLIGFEKSLSLKRFGLKSHLYGWNLEKVKKIWVRFFLKFQSALDHLLEDQKFINPKEAKEMFELEDHKKIKHR